ncbi:hypothetical protein K8354_12265 [Polaribacter litorisediminis]|uniref:hypothetical protein n=1 Tax=Polaribacter litorisediminis TaxID=1908341 RepID=UPI001CC0915C|nr:hypothetical protein [Polaribacter litorisediminis]UAM97091.1 hypothetical protein K8354_12265 [Polaribacter litorisediminis]
MKSLFYIFLLVLLVACSSKKETEVQIKKSNLYKQSEMAALMLQMYDANLENKQLILEGKTPVNFSKKFANIHTATLTDPADRDASFQAFSEFYLDSYQQVFRSSKDSLVLKHNNTINSCIACHKTTCIGPIPKIKKLLIP